MTKYIEEEIEALELFELDSINDNVAERMSLLKNWDKENLIANTTISHDTHRLNPQRQKVSKSYFSKRQVNQKSYKDHILDVIDRYKTYLRANYIQKKRSNYSIVSNLDNGLLILQNINYFKKQFGFHIFKNDKSQTVFEEYIKDTTNMIVDSTRIDFRSPVLKSFRISFDEDLVSKFTYASFLNLIKVRKEHENFYSRE